ncbi:hypothetical protein [Sphingomonas sp. DC2300-3]|uniref:Abi-alpha family protein n=1 Tax=unclassified Sphingomonas TaxID=196159 RepID=UPI003CEE406F
MAIDVTKMIEPAKAVLAPAGGTLSEAWAAVIGDRIATWRLKNAAELQLKVNREWAALGLKVDRSKIPERYAIAWFEEATKQDEAEIQTLFARLLARAAAGDEDAADRRLLEIVTRLTPFDAKVLVWLFEKGGPPPRHPEMSEYEAWKGSRADLGEQASISIDHLVALGVFERQFNLVREVAGSSWRGLEFGDTINSLADDMASALSVTATLSASYLGLALYAACFAPSAAASA